MSVLKIKDHDIYYEEHGKGIPILFMEGLGYSMWMWKYQLPTLEKWARCILVDNRGVGRSSGLTSPYSVREFAEDALAVLDHLGIGEFYVLGVSMGGFIAQQVSILSKNRVKGEILISTSCGGKRSLPMSQETWNEMSRAVQGESTRDKLNRTMKLALTKEFVEDRKREFDSIIEERLNFIQDPTQLVYQALSTRDFDVCSENRELTIPVLIICGTKDRTLPWVNSLILYKSLRESSLLIFENQNHLLFIEEAEKINREVEAFIRSVEEDSYSPFIREVG